MLPVKAVIFIALNVVRLLSIITLLLVFSSAVDLIAQDSKAYNALKASGDLKTYIDEYCYFPDSEVPTSTWGLFWVQFDRFNILCITLLGIFAEISVVPIDRFLSIFLPPLGPSFSTGPLGIMQVLEGFALRISWLLFFVGLLNIVMGLIFRSRGKLRRSLFRRKRLLWEKMRAADANGPTRLQAAKTTFRSLFKTPLVDPSQPGGTSRSCPAFSYGDRQTNASYSSARQVQPIRTALDAFIRKSGTPAAILGTKAYPADMAAAPDEILRQRAREENLRIEKALEQIEREQSSVRLDEDFKWNAKYDMPVPQSRRAESPLTELLKGESLRHVGSCKGSIAHSYAQSHVGKGEGFKRRSLVLSKMIDQVKGPSTSIRKRKGPSRLRPSSCRAIKKLIAPRTSPSAWIEVQKSEEPPRAPLPTYQTKDGIIYEDLGNDETRTHYHSVYETPVADKYMYSAW